MTSASIRASRLLAYVRNTIAEAMALKASIPSTEDYDVVSADYEKRLFDAFIGYASSSGASTKWRNQVRRAIVDDFAAAFYSGYVEAGGEETESEDEKWLTARVKEEIGYVDNAFDSIFNEREAETVTEDSINGRVQDWVSNLNSVYSEGKLRGNENKMLTFDGDDGEESCTQCQKFKGKRHSAKWWLKRDLIRRNGNEHFDCGRWGNCHHDLYDDDGEMYTR